LLWLSFFRKQKGHTPSREKENDALKGNKDPSGALTLLA